VDIGEGGPEQAGHGLLAFRSGGRSAGPEVVADVIGGKDVVNNGDIALIPNFLIKAADQRLILFYRHRFLLLNSGIFLLK
jgi:hypothetical protein